MPKDSFAFLFKLKLLRVLSHSIRLKTPTVIIFLTLQILLKPFNSFASEQTQCAGSFKNESLLSQVSKTVDLNWLFELLSSNPGITSVERLISALPASMRSNFTLMKQSRSAQFGDELNPRTIVYSPKGELVVAFSSRADQRGYSNLEAYGFNRSTGTYEFRQISFRSDFELTQRSVTDRKNQKEFTAQSLGLQTEEIFLSNQNLIISKANPARCATCHSSGVEQVLRPIWSPYPTWKGAYGERDDGLYNVKNEDANKVINAEKKSFLVFKKHLSGRYAQLSFDPSNPFSPYIGDLTDIQYEVQGHPKRAVTNLMNNNLNLILGRSYAQQIAKHIFSLIKSPDDLYYLLFRLQYSENSDRFSAISRLIEKKYGNYYYDNFTKRITNFNTPIFTDAPNGIAALIQDKDGEWNNVGYHLGIPEPRTFWLVAPPFNGDIVQFIQLYLQRLIIESSPELKIKFVKVTDHWLQASPAVYDSSIENDMRTYYKPKNEEGFKSFLLEKLEAMAR